MRTHPRGRRARRLRPQGLATSSIASVAHGETLDDDASRLQLIEHVQSGGPRKPAKSRYMMWFSQRRDHRRKSSVGAVSSAASEQHKQGKLLSRMSTSSLLGGRKQSEAVLS